MRNRKDISIYKYNDIIPKLFPNPTKLYKILQNKIKKNIYIIYSNIRLKIRFDVGEVIFSK